MIRLVKKQYPALQPVRNSFATSLAYSLAICLVATILPLYESLNVWTLLLFMLAAAVALPHILPRLREALPQKNSSPQHSVRVSKVKTLKKYDRLLHAALLGSLGFIAYYLYFAARSISGYGVEPSSAEHASATSLAYLTIFLGCAVSIVAYKKGRNNVLAMAIVGLVLFVALPYLQLGRSLGFGRLTATDVAASIILALVYAGILYLLHHGRAHTRSALLADHPAETLAHHTSKR